MENIRSGRLTERMLRCTDNAIAEVHAIADETDSSAGAIETYRKVAIELNTELARQRSFTDKTKKKSCAKACLEAYLHHKVFRKVQTLLQDADGQAAVVASTASVSTARFAATLVVSRISQTAFILLHHACLMFTDLTVNCAHGSDRSVASKAFAAMTQIGFMYALAQFVRRVVSTSTYLRSETAVWEHTDTVHRLARSWTLVDEQAGVMVLAVCQYALSLTEALVQLLSELGAFTATRTHIHIPPDILETLEALVDTQLLAAAATALVDVRPIDATPQLKPEVREVIMTSMQQGAVAAAKATANVHQLQQALGRVGGRVCKRLSAGLRGVVRHEAVRRLRVGLLDQLAAHAGLGAKLEETQEGLGRQGGRADAGEEQAGAEQEGWEGLSGSWWFAGEEARRAQLGLGPAGEGRGSGRAGRQALGETGGWLEDYHCHIVCVTFMQWVLDGQEGAVAAQAAKGAAAAGVLDRPPPLLAAQLAARAAEALCRLCRGEGLGGEYSPAPEWQFAMAQVLVRSMLPVEEDLPGAKETLSAATAQACLPYWLETAGWLAALLSDAAAAAMGRMPATPRPETLYSKMHGAAVEDGTQAGTLKEVAKALARIAYNGTCGFKTLSLAAQADVRRRMSRCGLVASVDHTLRLAFSAQDSGMASLASELGVAGQVFALPTEAGLTTVLPPAHGRKSSNGAQAGGGSSGTQGGSSSDADGGGDAAQAGAHVGLLCTLSKRAAMLTRALDAMPGAASGSAQGPGDGSRPQQATVWVPVGAVLTGLEAAVGSVEEDVWGRVAAARRGTAGACAEGDGAAAACLADGACVDQVHEALALAARAASNLAASFALQLTAGFSGPVVETTAGLHNVGTRTVCDVTVCMLRWGRRALLPPEQLLACQPHRLLAAACTLAAALPDTPELAKHKNSLCMLVPGLVAMLASHEALSGQVRGWLAPPPAAAGGSSGGGSSSIGSSSSSESGPDPCAGCLAGPVKSVVRVAVQRMPSYAAHAEALVVAAEGRACGGAGGRGTGALGAAAMGAGGRGAGDAKEADGGFRRFAAAVAERIWERVHNNQPGGFEDVPMPDGTLPSLLLVREAGAGGVQQPTLAPESLPPPLVLPPSRAGALPRLRMCGNPRCSNFTQKSEGALPLKQCGGCRAVRYCGAECQRAHWREGHKAECKELMAAVGG